MNMQAVDTVAFIPAKGTSKGIPGKNKKQLMNIPLIGYTMLAALESELIDMICVISDDMEIMDICRRYHYIYPEKNVQYIQEPPEYTQDWVQCDDVCHLGYKTIVHNLGQMPETCLLLHPTSPFRYASDIDTAIEIYKDAGGTGTLISGSTIKGFGYIKKQNGSLTPAGHDPMQRFGRQWTRDNHSIFVEDGGIYVFNGHEFMHRRVVRFPPYLAYNVPDSERYIDLDEMEDWNRAEKYMLESGWNVSRQYNPGDEYSI